MGRRGTSVIWLTGLVLAQGWVLAGDSPPPPAQGPPTSATAEELFARRVWPFLQAKCLGCHGKDPDDLQGGLDLRSLPAALRGGARGEPALVPGQPDASWLYVAATRQDPDLRMPPKENARASAAELAALRSWIAGGAPWPSPDRIAKLATPGTWDAAEGVVVATSGGLSETWTNRRYRPADLWAYRPLRKPVVPSSPGARGETDHPIDAFVNAGLQAAGLEPAPPADRRTLLRRVTFDLIGLPPTPAEMAEFLSDPQPDDVAFAKVVDRLLASPHYGEHWGRHWLDVVRYADSSGFANDYIRGTAWRYRDYVIRSFNADKPYDRFVREQLAGDELDPDNPEALVAVGFLRMGPWELTGMEVAQVARQRFLDDVTDIVGQVFLAHMLQCARCHDHKFDPVPTRDYYSLQAVFATTQLADRPAPLLPGEHGEGREDRKYLKRRREDHLAVLRELDAKSLEAAEAWFRDQKRNRSLWDEAVAQVRAKPPAGRGRDFVGVFESVRAQLLQRGVPEDQFPPKLHGFSPADYGRERVARKGLERLRWEFETFEPIACSVYSGPTPELRSVNAPLRMPADLRAAGTLEQTAILAGGDPFAPTQRVTPGVLSAVQSLGQPAEPSAGGGLPAPEIPTTPHGRRAALAGWITHPAHPLTPRVIVNRVWGWHFGLPLAGNPNNFGATGQKPAHPELLDWLAATFVEQGWSLKTLHRLILSSAAYRRSSHAADPSRLVERDPHGTSLAVFRPRRLTAEELRDALLAVSGELRPMLGGIPVRPEMHRDVALQPRQVMGTFAEAWQPSPLPSQRHRRSVYVLQIRGLGDPFLQVFNAPSPDLSCEARDASTITPQVFSLFNGQGTHDRALAFAARLRRECATAEAALERAFELALGRPPQPAERELARAHWQSLTARHRQLAIPRRTYPTEVVRVAVEENTGETFAFTEPLHVARDFVPDLQPADVDAETRGLADLCLVLFNSNEFAYVD